MFVLAKRGAGAKPLQRKRCHSEAATAVRYAAEESRAAPIYKGGAEPVRGALQSITVCIIAECYVCACIRQSEPYLFNIANKITV